MKKAIALQVVHELPTDCIWHAWIWWWFSWGKAFQLPVFLEPKVDNCTKTIFDPYYGWKGAATFSCQIIESYFPEIRRALSGARQVSLYLKKKKQKQKQNMFFPPVYYWHGSRYSAPGGKETSSWRAVSQFWGTCPRLCLLQGAIIFRAFFPLLSSFLWLVLFYAFCKHYPIKLIPWRLLLAWTPAWIGCMSVGKSEC